MTDGLEGFTAECDWCNRDVVSPVEPPLMPRVQIQLPRAGKTMRWRICHACFTDLIVWMSHREEAAPKQWVTPLGDDN